MTRSRCRITPSLVVSLRGAGGLPVKVTSPSIAPAGGGPLAGHAVDSAATVPMTAANHRPAAMRCSLRSPTPGVFPEVYPDYQKRLAAPPLPRAKSFSYLDLAFS